MRRRPVKLRRSTVLAWRRDVATENGTCPACGKPIASRERVIRDDDGAAVHPACAEQVRHGE